MSDNIEVFENGQAGFVSGHNQVAWHRLGTVVEGALTIKEALDLSLLGGWDVRCVPLTTEAGTAVPNNYATVRTNPVTKAENVLGVVGGRYEPIQNEIAFATLDNIQDIGGALFETAGSLAHGSKVFVTQKLGEGIQVGGEDQVDTYLLATTTHDGSGKLTIATTQVRVVCQNTLDLALRGVKRVYTVKHTKNAQARIDEARTALAISFKYTEEFEAEANALYAESFSETEFRRFLDSLVPIDAEDGRGKTIAVNKQAAIKAIYHDAPTQVGIKGTKWGAYNAVVEYADFHAPVRGGDSKADRRAETVLLGSNDLKQRAYDLISA